MKLLTSQAPPTATALIRIDHDRVQGLFHELLPDAPPSARQATIRDLCAALEIHAQLEEEIFYPALRQAGITSPALDKSVPEHDDMQRLIERVRSFDGQDAAQADAVNQLMNAVLHHVADEETQLLPAAERWLGSGRLLELGERMSQRRVALAGPRVAEPALDTLRAAPARTTLVAVAALTAGVLLMLGRRRRSRDWLLRY